jgi:TldD protein
MGFSDSFFAIKFGITEHDLQNYISEALSSGGDYADLYFEYVATTSISLDEGIVKSAVQGVSMGVGVRVISGERTGYAYSDDLAPEKIRKAARVAACIAKGPSQIDKTGFSEAGKRNLYPVLVAPTETNLADRVRLVKACRQSRPRCRSARYPGAGRLCGQPGLHHGRDQRRSFDPRSPASCSHGR